MSWFRLQRHWQQIGKVLCSFPGILMLLRSVWTRIESVHAPSLFKYFLLQGSCLTRVFRPLILRKAKGENVHEPNSCCLRNIKRHKQRKRNRGCAGCVYNKRRNRQIRPWSVLFLHYYLCLCQSQDWDQCLQPFLCLEPQLHLNLDPFLRIRRKITDRILERSQKWVNYDCYS